MTNNTKIVLSAYGRIIGEYLPDTASFTIGSDLTNNLVLNYPEVVSHHLKAVIEAENLTIEKLRAEAPLTINGTVREGTTIVKPGDRIQLGGVVSFFVTQRNSENIKPQEPDSPMLKTQFARKEAPRLKVTYFINNIEHTKEYILDKPRFRIGRSEDNDIVIPVSVISRWHADLSASGDTFFIRDLKSTNGLIYNGEHLDELLLKNEDILRIGDALGNIVTLSYLDYGKPIPSLETVFDISSELEVITIGRTPDNVVVLNFPQVSAHHAVITKGQNLAKIQDLGSTNGTFINDKKVTRKSVEIFPGDKLQIAGYRLTYNGKNLTQFDSSQIWLDGVALSKKAGSTRILLNNISVSIKPLELVALVGGSGAGKSTLMDALNGFRPADEGQVIINGEDYYVNFATYRNQLGYVPQDDIIHRELTVERALYYLAKLRLPPDTKKAEIKVRIEEVLKDVELTSSRNVEITRLSGGQRKRASIAAELIARPVLFFLDEPTSGLDPGLDKKLMFLLRRLADAGRTVVLVTHATANINVCDKVAFLGKGGRLCYFGPPAEALKFFEVNEFADIYSKLEATENNPAEWEDKFRRSADYQTYIAKPQSRLNLKPNTTAIPTIAKQKPFRQFSLLALRYIELLFRDRVNLLVLLLQAPIIGLILAMVGGQNIWNIGSSPADGQRILFMLSIAGVWLGTNNSAREITKENAIYLRERMVNLGVVPYILSKVIVLAILSLVQTLMLVGIVLLIVGVPPHGVFFSAFFELCLGVFLTTLGGVGMGLFISTIASNTDKAISIVPVILIPQIILAGVIFDLNGPSKALSYATVSRWSLEALGTSADLNQLYFSQPTMGISVPCESDKGYDPRNYSTNPCEINSRGEHGTREGQLLLRLVMLGTLFVVFLGLAIFFQKRKDRRWQRR
ncbi:MAG: FHA domain-containing protein [Chloroflexi bacterium]|uniref:FHA domain-containing protein n=1 Tax=Candidatus Chlorohelix allophototropha TaxID=3003348 RepID=A0A8T7M5G7_9CHLR|nr:FHA domain-containing protein [Chloroflexota bacterium]WJW69194.1 FHA domain-containing protein [Chloroflexota bacterium L227-S17]